MNIHNTSEINTKIEISHSMLSSDSSTCHNVYIYTSLEYVYFVIWLIFIDQCYDECVIQQPLVQWTFAVSYSCQSNNAIVSVVQD